MFSCNYNTGKRARSRRKDIAVRFFNLSNLQWDPSSLLGDRCLFLFLMDTSKLGKENSF